MENLGAAQDALAELLAASAPDDWARPTPCPEWDVALLGRAV